MNYARSIKRINLRELQTRDETKDSIFDAKGRKTNNK